METITRKKLNKLLTDLGFHHSWGQWISNENNSHRMRLQPSRRKNKNLGYRTFGLAITKHATSFQSKYELRIIPTQTTLQDVKEYVKEFFLNPMKDKK